MRGKRVLVSGAGGFIGRTSVAPLLARGYEVHAVVAPQGRFSAPAALAPDAVHPVDLLDAAAVESLLARVAPSHLLHFAWIATPGIYWTSPLNARWLAAGETLLAAFRRHGGVRAVLAGSCAEYDWSRGGVYHEASPLATDVGAATAATAATGYAAAKIGLERRLAAFGRDDGLSGAWGRIFFQYGPHEDPARLVPATIVSLLEGRAARCTHGRQIRSFLHVADVGAAFAALLDSPVEGPVNIGSPEPVSIGELVSRIGAQVGRPDLLRFGAIPAPVGEPAVLLPDVRRLTEEVGWRPSIGLDDGLADAIAWWRGLKTPRPSR